MVCGPTSGGKSALADDLADGLSDALGALIPTVVVDSVQVYRGLAAISNQARRRPAHLVGTVPVTERWTVARHREATREAVGGARDFVLDAGTGMYLNAVLLDFPLAPPVGAPIRAMAQKESTDAANPRHAARRRELALAGVERGGSVWEGGLVYDTTLLYLRPQRHTLDRNIAARSKRIVRGGADEARDILRRLQSGADVNPSVLQAVGVKELLDLVSGKTTPDEAAARVAARTRRLARRQMTWFDKLARMLGGRCGVSVFEDPADVPELHTMHDTMGA